MSMQDIHSQFFSASKAWFLTPSLGTVFNSSLNISLTEKQVKVQNPLLLFSPILQKKTLQIYLNTWTLPKCFIHCFWQPLPESLREEDSQCSRSGGHHTHDEDRCGEPVHLEHVQQEGGDAPYPGHQGAGTNSLVTDNGGKHLCSVHIHNGKRSRCTKFPNKRQRDLKCPAVNKCFKS